MLGRVVEPHQSVQADLTTRACKMERVPRGGPRSAPDVVRMAVSIVERKIVTLMVARTGPEGVRKPLEANVHVRYRERQTRPHLFKRNATSYVMMRRRLGPDPFP